MANLQMIGSTAIQLGDMQHCKYHCELFLDRRKQIALTSAKEILLSDLILLLEDKNFTKVAKNIVNPLLRSGYIVIDEKSVVNVNSTVLSKITLFLGDVEKNKDKDYNFSVLCKNTYRVIKCLSSQYRIDVLQAIVKGDYTLENIVSRIPSCHTLACINDLMNNGLAYEYKGIVTVDIQEITRIIKLSNNFLHNQ